MKRAFTLVELVIVIAIIGLMAAILIPAFNEAIDSGRESIVEIYNNINKKDSEIIAKDNETHEIIYEGKMSEWENKSDYELINLEKLDNILILYVSYKEITLEDINI